MRSLANWWGGLVFLLTLTALVVSGAAHALDPIILPPEQREVASPGGGFLLLWKTLDGWNTLHAQAELYSVTGAQRRMIWRQTLPHRHGPRQGLVSDAGRVLLTDEWMNTPSPHAIMVLDPRGQVIADYSIEQVIAVLGVPVRQVGERAKTSAWITEGPTLSADGATAEVKAGGHTLVTRLADGQLSRKD